MDALMQLLHSYGYQPVFLPQAGLKPPELYNLSDGQLIRRGPLSGYLPKGILLEPNKHGQQANIQHKETSSKKYNGAVEFLGKALGCIGIGAPKINLSFTGSKTFAFSFTGVTYERTEGLDHALRTLDTGAIPAEYVRTGKLHIAYEYLYAEALLMSWTIESQKAIDIGGVKIAEYIDLGGSGRVEAVSATVLKFKALGATEPAAFAYKAGRLEKKGSRWEFHIGSVADQWLVPSEKMPESFEWFLPARGVVLTAING